MPEDVAELVSLSALAEEVELPSAMLEDMLEAMLETEDMAEVAEAAALSEAAEELPLGAGVELAEAEPSHVAAVGRLFTPWPAQREFANSRVSELGSVRVSWVSNAFFGATGILCFTYSSGHLHYRLC